MTQVKFKVDLKAASYLAANPTKVLLDNEPIFIEDGRVAFGDGATELSDLTWYRMVPVSSELISGGNITVGSYGGSGSNNDVRISAARWYVVGYGDFSTPGSTDFLDLALSTAGTQRYVGFFGKNDGTMTKVEGTAAAVATLPATPADSAVIGYVIVGDASIGGSVDLAGYLLKADKATAATVGTGTNDETYITPYALKNAPTVTTVTSSATPTPAVSANPVVTDVLQISALAEAATIAAPTGTATNHKNLIIRIKDSGVARALSFNAIYRFSTDLAAPTTTVINKTLYLGFRYNSAETKWDCLAILNNL